MSPSAFSRRDLLQGGAAAALTAVMAACADDDASPLNLGDAGHDCERLPGHVVTTRPGGRTGL